MISATASELRSVLAGRLKLTSSRKCVWMRCSWPLTSVELFPPVVVQVPALEHLHQGTDGRQRVADFVGDAGGQQAEGGHLLLVQHVGLGFLQFARALGDAGFELRLVLVQGGVEPAQLIADALEQHGHGAGCPGHPDQDQDHQHQSNGDAARPAAARYNAVMVQCSAQVM